MLVHYSNGVPPLCECCGEDAVEFLSIDHIDGGGSKHRAQIKGSYSSIYLWLKKKGFPEGYRVLCMNCNTALGFYGYCPHQGTAENED